MCIRDSSEAGESHSHLGMGSDRRIHGVDLAGCWSPAVPARLAGECLCRQGRARFADDGRTDRAPDDRPCAAAHLLSLIHILMCIRDRLMRLRPGSTVFHTVATRENTGDRHHEHLPKVMPRPIAGLSGIIDFVQAFHQNHAFRRAHWGHPKDESRRDFRWVYKMMA